MLSIKNNRSALLLDLPILLFFFILKILLYSLFSFSFLHLRIAVGQGKGAGRQTLCTFIYAKTIWLVDVLNGFANGYSNLVRRTLEMLKLYNVRNNKGGNLTNC